MNTILRTRVDEARKRLCDRFAARTSFPVETQGWIDWRPTLERLRQLAAARRPN